jgi:predicted lipid-binding transport protein (Tim44 family)
MKTKLVRFFLPVLGAALLASCGGPNSQTGAVLGGLGGAAVGGIIGNQSGRGLEGAAIGAGLGALGGAAVGDAQDKRNARYYGNPYYRQQPPPPPPSYYGNPYYR